MKKSTLFTVQSAIINRSRQPDARQAAGTSSSGYPTIRRFLFLSILAAFSLMAVGCGRAGRRDDRERNKRSLSKAYEQLDREDYASAEVLFKRALDTNPTLARPHLDLAFLLHDRRRDFPRAIYHYQRYIELRPNTEKRDMIDDRIAQAERFFAAKHMIADAKEGRSVQDLLNENRQLHSQLAGLQGKMESLEKELAAMRDADRRRVLQEVSGGMTGDIPQESVSVSIPELPERPQIPEPRYPVPTAAPLAELNGKTPVGIETAPSQEPMQEPVVMDHGHHQTYVVRDGDSLSRIAYKVYGDALKWRIIQEANQAVLGESVNVRVGQTLDIPKVD